MKNAVLSVLKTASLFSIVVLFGVILVRIMFYVDFFYFKEYSYVVYAILYLAGVIACCKR